VNPELLSRGSRSLSILVSEALSPSSSPSDSISRSQSSISSAERDGGLMTWIVPIFLHSKGSGAVTNSFSLLVRSEDILTTALNEPPPFWIFFND
jgi:hypothetical protein